MKRKLLALSLLPLFLFSCGQENIPTSDARVSSSVTSKTIEDKEDYSIKLSDNGLSVARSEYIFTLPKEGDHYYPEAYIRMMVDTTWRYCSMLNEKETKFFVEDETAIKAEGLSLKIVAKADLGGSSNEIGAIDINFDRAKVNVGKTKIKVQLKPGNGVSSMNVITTICFNLEIRNYGEIEVPTYKGSLEVNTKGLKALIEKESKTATEVTLNITDLAEMEGIYGINADIHKEARIPLDDLDNGAKIDNFVFAVNHKYNAFIYVGGESSYDVIWIGLADVANSPSYSLKEGTRGNAILEVFEDNALIRAKLGNYSAI